MAMSLKFLIETNDKKKKKKKKKLTNIGKGGNKIPPQVSEY